jgi:hypothetical protein
MRASLTESQFFEVVWAGIFDKACVWIVITPTAAVVEEKGGDGDHTELGCGSGHY